MLKSSGFFQKYYTRGAFIAKGCYGKVYEVYEKKTMRKFALKIIETDVRSVDKRSQWGGLTNFLPDIVQLFIEKHPAIAEIMLFFEGTDKDSGLQTFNILMEFLPETLEQEMTKFQENNKQYSFPHVLKMFMSLIQGLHFLQVHHIAHRDLKPSNIMRDNVGNYKIIDLGISIPNFDKTLTQRRTIAGTLMYMAPEILKAFVDGAQEVEYNPHKSDCYSIGFIMLKVCLVDEDVCPLGVQNEEALLKKQNMLNKVARRYNRPLMKVIELMLESDPVKRPDFKELLELLAVVGDSEENQIQREQLLSLGNLSLSQHKELLLRNRVVTSSYSSLNSFQMVESSPFPFSQAGNTSRDGLTINIPPDIKPHEPAEKTNQKYFFFFLLYISFENVMTVTNTSIIQRQIYGDVSNNILNQGIAENYFTSTVQAILYLVFPIFASAGIERYGCYPTLLFSTVTKIVIQTFLLLFDKVYSTFWPSFFCIFISLLTCINVDLVLTTILIKKIRTEKISTCFSFLFISFKMPGIFFFLPSFTDTEDSPEIYISSTVLNYVLYFLSFVIVLHIKRKYKNVGKISESVNHPFEKANQIVQSTDRANQLLGSQAIQSYDQFNQPLLSSNFLGQSDNLLAHDQLSGSSELNNSGERIKAPHGRLKGWRAVLASDLIWLLAFFFAFTNSIQYLFKEQLFVLYVRKNLYHFERERNRFMVLLAVSLVTSPIVGYLVDKCQKRFDVMMGLMILILLNFILSITTEGLEQHLYHFVLYAMFYGGFYSIFLPCVAILVSKKALTLSLCIIYTIENFFFSVLDFMIVNSFDTLDKEKMGFKVMSVLLMLTGITTLILQRRRKISILNGPYSLHHIE